MPFRLVRWPLGALLAGLAGCTSVPPRVEAPVTVSGSDQAARRAANATAPFPSLSDFTPEAAALANQRITARGFPPPAGCQGPGIDQADASASTEAC